MQKEANIVIKNFSTTELFQIIHEGSVSLVAECESGTRTAADIFPANFQYLAALSATA